MHRFRLLVIVLILATQGCNLAASTPPPTPTTEPSPTAAPPTATVLPTDTVSPTEAPTATTAASATPAGVTITASGGGINIRRGPSIQYNAISGLQEGNLATALARNADGSWLFIPLPGDSSKFGWISTQSGFSTIQGEVSSLAEQPYPPAVPAYIRNCTFHTMLVKPGDVQLKDQTYSPDNKKQFNPGEYRIYDQIESNTLVKTLRLSEGDSLDITTDGLNNVYACP
jgi:hypothetical protein